jgi:hypothetical protein
MSCISSHYSLEIIVRIVANLKDPVLTWHSAANCVAFAYIAFVSVISLHVYPLFEEVAAGSANFTTECCIPVANMMPEI